MHEKSVQTSMFKGSRFYLSCGYVSQVEHLLVFLNFSCIETYYNIYLSLTLIS